MLKLNFSIALLGIIRYYRKDLYPFCAVSLFIFILLSKIKNKGTAEINSTAPLLYVQSITQRKGFANPFFKKKIFFAR